jgi:hypothetical protein
MALDRFHILVDELLWYLNHTQDMVKTAEDKVTNQCRQLQRLTVLLSFILMLRWMF